MAALSCYQPCRSHLAQPARCLDEDEDPSPATFSLRRRQFIERCHEARARPREPPSEPQASVRRTREEFTKHVAAPVPLNRRVNVESGWSKVEEVRKKFEGAAASANYSRSFESPPRRRLADSLFASFKLPRKKDGMASRQTAPAQQKRKSAVELLAETKAYYVKSETVLDRKQELPLRQNQISSGLQGAIAAGGCRLISSGTLNNDPCCNPYATTRLPATRRAVSAGDGLQHTLRKLIEPSDDSIYAVPKKPPVKVTPQILTMMPTPYKKDGKLVREIIIRPYGFGDAVLLPDEFFVPRKKHEVDAMPIPNKKKGMDMSPEKIIRVDSVLSDGEPAEVIAYGPLAYKEAHRYMRSNSHSQPSMREEDGGLNINSHKSLPDLHAQARCYPDREHMAAGDSVTVGRSPRRRRHSPHQRTASCSSKGTRSNHSSLMSSCDAFSEHPSPGEENYQSYNSRCGSSFARDSGGSSGHYTQRSAPPHPPHHPHHQQRNDSGSSTQHEHSRYGLYYAEECYSPQLEGVVVSAPPQFQDGAPSPPPPPLSPLSPHPPHHSLEPLHHQPRVGIHFQASAPPPQFQDDPPQYDYNDYDCGYKSNKCISLSRKEREYRERDYNRYHEQTSDMMRKEPQYAETRQPRARIDDTQDYVNTTQMCPSEEVTSPLGTFKRQRCLRYKQRRPRPILRSKSDISDRYRRSDGRSPASAPCEGEDSPDSPSEESSRLQQFFERLGLEARQYDALYRDPPPDSPIFFSSASTVDSNQLATVDYTVQGPGAPKQVYRNTEPPSVVERNARIIKWLCQCRKTQLPPPQ